MPKLLLEFSENSEINLLLKVAEGSEAAFTELFHAYHDKLYSFLYSISDSKQVAEDIVQEVFLKIWQKRAELKYIREFDSYLFRMARNHAVNAFKRMAKESLILKEKEQLSNEASEIPVELEFKEARVALREAVAKLPGKQKEVFLLSREHGLKQAEISRLLNITIPTVKSHMTQAIHTIRKVCKNIYPITKVVFLFLSSFLN